MKMQNVIIGLSIAVLLVLTFAIKPYFRQRDTMRIVQTVLTHWENGDLTLAMPYWENEVDSPPIYDLTAYKIEERKMSKKDGVYSANIVATLDFPPDNIFPSGKKWIFELNKTRYGWKIMDFHLLKN